MDLAELFPGLVKHKCSQCRNPIPKHVAPKYIKMANGKWYKCCGRCNSAMTDESPSEKRAREKAKQDERDRAEAAKLAKQQDKLRAKLAREAEKARQKRQKEKRNGQYW